MMINTLILCKIAKVEDRFLCIVAIAGMTRLIQYNIEGEYTCASRDLEEATSNSFCTVSGRFTDKPLGCHDHAP